MSFDSEVPSEFIPRSGEWVRELQRLLERAGYWSQERSEEYDDRVESAVKLFQGGYGLEVDGVPNSATWAALAPLAEGGADPGGHGSLFKSRGAGHSVALRTAR